METMQWCGLRFSSGRSSKGAPRQEISKWSRCQNRLFHYPPEAYGKRFATRFREVGGALQEIHRFPREVLRKKRPSPHHHEVPTRSSKVSPRTFQMALVHSWTGSNPDRLYHSQVTNLKHNDSITWYGVLLNWPERGAEQIHLHLHNTEPCFFDSYATWWRYPSIISLTASILPIICLPFVVHPLKFSR
jgi:hypothetical protein